MIPFRRKTVFYRSNAIVISYEYDMQSLGEDFDFWQITTQHDLGIAERFQKQLRALIIVEQLLRIVNGSVGHSCIIFYYERSH